MRTLDSHPRRFVRTMLIVAGVTIATALVGCSDDSHNTNPASSASPPNGTPQGEQVTDLTALVRRECQRHPEDETPAAIGAADFGSEADTAEAFDSCL